MAEVAQQVERRTENPCVPSSILGLGTTIPRIEKRGVRGENFFVSLKIVNFSAKGRKILKRNHQGSFLRRPKADDSGPRHHLPKKGGNHEEIPLGNTYYGRNFMCC